MVVVELHTVDEFVLQRDDCWEGEREREGEQRREGGRKRGRGREGREEEGITIGSEQEEIERGRAILR